MLTDFAPFFDDHNTDLLSPLLFKLLEPNCGTETCGTSADNAHVDLIRDALDRAEIYVLVP